MVAISIITSRLRAPRERAIPLPHHAGSQYDTISTMSRKVQGGASLLVGWRLGGKHVLIVGGGKEASGRVFFALDADAKVTIVCPASGLNDDVELRINNGELIHLDRNFHENDLDTADMVLSCIDQHEESRRIAVLCRARRIPVNCADIPELCDFYFFAQYRDGPVQFGISTNGCGPRIGARLRDLVVKALPEETAAAVDRIGRLRRKIRESDPDPNSSGRRMTWLSRLCDGYTFEEMAQLDDQDLLTVLESYERGDSEPPPAPTKKSQSRLVNESRVKSPSDSSSTSTNKGLVEHAQTLPIIGGVVNLVASATGTAWNITSSTVTGTVQTASSMGAQVYDISTTYASALKETGAGYAHHAKIRAEDVVETGLRSLPQPVSQFVRGGLNLLPLPIHVSRNPRGRLVLVGAGPGDPGLLTVRALEAMRQADLVVSDQLIPSGITDLVPGKRLHLVQKKVQGRSDIAQNDANETCLAALNRGLDVVRLKGGDPFLFGRGGEEIAFFREHGFEADIVPGISSCIAAPESALIPVTHRGVADQLMVLSGRGEGGAYPNVPSYYEKRTTVVLMAVGRLEGLVELMLNSGYPNDVPAAVVEKGCWGKEVERVVQGTLETIYGKVLEAKVGAPALLIVGKAVSVLREDDPDSSLLIDNINKLDLD
ncbi:hypothetical protein PhCBS80983_g03662 [Powellomyces hirtus]|uniref:precorrin-2 dehydrogenase n=1 Tax=Powellomyces hirtus TaxID=109895 RepID=A0A507E0P3_9FUNG|nr:hypothetical protein PhCBS80983_g03662 [Powellomyces hirtus]